MSCRKSFKRWRHGLFKSFKILFCVERNSGNDTSRCPENLVNVHLGRRTVLPSEIENKLLEYCIIMDQRCYGLRRQDIKQKAFQFAIRNCLKHPFKQEKSEAGKKWLRLYLKRYPIISMRTPEGISASRKKRFTSDKL